MLLNQNQIDFYSENGYLIIENVFTEIEVDILKNTLDKFNELKDLPNVICEKNGQIRSVFAPHKHVLEYDWLFQQDRIILPSKQLVQEDIYLYQFKLNNKKALGGDWWEWHQDFPYWHLDDGVKLPDMVSVMILLQDTRSVQGPLIVIPGSHKSGIVEFEFKEGIQEEAGKQDLMKSLSADLKYTVQKEMIRKMVEKNDLVSCEGAAGTCVFFHPNLFHASNSNISPFDRNTAIITYNSVANIPGATEFPRPDYLCSYEHEAIVGINNDIILV